MVEHSAVASSAVLTLALARDDKYSAEPGKSLVRIQPAGFYSFFLAVKYNLLDLVCNLLFLLLYNTAAGGNFIVPTI